MKTQLIIPKKIKIGFNLRPDTYSGKLGYVIYHDGKIWRKEQSWESWRQKEATESDKEKCVENYTKNYYEPYHKSNPGSYPQALNYNEVPEFYKRQFKFAEGVEPIECDNVPTEGFVLNKKVGGYKSDWHVRETKSRVFDPRGFEFEIDIPNLLYILQETNSIKGKGLEGEFVYAWDGKELVLLPTCSPDYQSCLEFTKIQNNKVSAKNLIPGASYLTKREETYVYLGKFSWFPFEYPRSGNWENRYDLKKSREEKLHMFFDEKNNLQILPSLKNISNVISDTPVDNYAELIEKFNTENYSNKVIKLDGKIEKIEFSYPQENSYSSYSITGKFYKKIGENTYIKYSIHSDYGRNYNYKLNKYIDEFKGFNVYKDYEIKIDEQGFLIQKKLYTEYENGRYVGHKNREMEILKTEQDVLDKKFENLYVVLSNGKEIDYDTYSKY